MYILHELFDTVHFFFNEHYFAQCCVIEYTFIRCNFKYKHVHYAYNCILYDIALAQ